MVSNFLGIEVNVLGEELKQRVSVSNAWLSDVGLFGGQLDYVASGRASSLEVRGSEGLSQGLQRREDSSKATAAAAATAFVNSLCATAWRFGASRMPRAPIVFWLLAAAACAPTENLPAFSLETDHTRVAYREEQDRPCAGDLSELDSQVEFLQDVLGETRGAPIAVFVLPVDEVTELCSGAQGCYDAGSDRTFSPWNAVTHELSHAIKPLNSFPSEFWAEGSAQALVGRISLSDPTRALAVADLGSGDLPNYVRATHFQRHLIEEYGLASYENLVASGFAVQATFGLSPQELVAAFEADAPFAYPAFDACADAEVSGTGAGQWSASVEFSCDSTDATQYEREDFAGPWSASVGAAVHRTLELPEGAYDFRLEGGEAFSLEGCFLEALPEPPTGFRLDGDVFNAVERANATAYASGQTHRIRVTSGVYRVTLSSGTESEALLDFSVRRAD